MQAVIHKSFSIERSYPTTATRVFGAHSDPHKKRRWFAEGEGFIVDSYALDFQVGGFERCRFRHGDSPPVTFDGVYLDIVTSERIVFAYAMTIGGGTDVVLPRHDRVRGIGLDDIASVHRAHRVRGRQRRLHRAPRGFGRFARSACTRAGDS